MQLFRPAFAEHPLRLGRAPVRSLEQQALVQGSFMGDLKLFGLTFLTGFLFVSILIG